MKNPLFDFSALFGGDRASDAVMNTNKSKKSKVDFSSNAKKSNVRKEW
jgi:hypothetical protein